MNETLLPIGCYDTLPPFARLESRLDHQLLSHFESYGYLQVAPPLLEYTESLLAGRGAILSPQVMRVMDPHTQKVMGLRADMTLQIARIATSRLSGSPRPLRLCYSGSVLRMQGDSASATRHARQTGIELIGPDNAKADAEVILVTLRALQAVGIGHITLDINLPVLIGTILADSSLDNDELSVVFEALAHKDSTRLKQFHEPACDLLCELMQLSGPATETLKKLESAALPSGFEPHMERLREVIQILDQQKGHNVTLILDVTERGGLDYYNGISFAFFATQQSIELGRGGRYIIDRSQTRESAIGCTLYSNKLHRLMPTPTAPTKVYIEGGIEENDLVKLHDQGYITILAMPDVPSGRDIRNIARSQGCTFIYQSGDLKKI